MTYVNAITTKERVKSRISMTSTNLDTTIDSLIASATEFIQNYCGGRVFKLTTYTNEIYSGSQIDGSEYGLPYLVLNSAPVVAVSSFQYMQGLKSSPTWTDFYIEDYDVLNKIGAIRTVLPVGYNNIRVTYQAGYEIDFENQYDPLQHNLPFDLSDLCERLVAKRIKKRNSEGIKQESVTDSDITWGEYMEKEDYIILSPYRRTHIV